MIREPSGIVGTRTINIRKRVCKRCDRVSKAPRVFCPVCGGFVCKDCTGSRGFISGTRCVDHIGQAIPRDLVRL